MTRAILLCGVVAVLAGTGVASEEEFLPAHKVSIVAAGRSFGEVAATIEMKRDGDAGKIKSVTLKIADKEFAVPEEQFADLRNPLLKTAEFRTEGGRDKGPPWLYLTFRLARAKAGLSESPLVYIKFRDGKLMGRSIHDPQKTALDAQATE